MSSAFSSYVWTRSNATGPARLVMLALADCANANGVAQLSLRDLAAMCRLSKTRVDQVISGLVEAGELRIMSSGGGRSNPAKYWITLRTAGVNCPEAPKGPECEDKTAQAERAVPTGENAAIADMSVTVAAGVDLAEPETKGPRPTPAPIAPATPRSSQADIDAVLSAVGVAAPPDLPFFWARKEHREDLAGFLARKSLSVDELCVRLRAAVERGRRYEHAPRSVAQIVRLMEAREVSR